MQNTKIQRRAVLLAEYGARIEYRKGKHNIRADMLSRIPPDQLAVISDLSSDPPEIEEENTISFALLEADGINKQELSRLQAKEYPAEFDEACDEEGDGEYEIVNGVLVSHRLPYAGARSYERILLPKKYQTASIQRAHETTGHRATSGTLRRIAESYVWPGLRRQVQEYIRTCPTCLAHSRRQIRPPMGDIEIPPTPMQNIGIDFIGPFSPADPQGNRYLLTVVDHLSGWAEAYPAKDQSAQEIIRIITERYIPVHQQPAVIICDNGQGLGSKAWSIFCRQAGIDLRHSSPAHPQSNGKTERLNRTLKETLQKRLGNRPERWHEEVASTLAAYRITTSSVTGHSPFFVLFGRQPRVPLERYLGESSFGNRLDDLTEAYRDAKKGAEITRQANRRRLELRSNVGESLRVGDHVVVKAEERLTNTARWDPRFIVTRVQGLLHWIRHQTTGQERRVNREKIQLVDPDIVWDNLPERPRRRRAPQQQTLPPPRAAPTPPVERACERLGELKLRITRKVPSP